MKKIGGGQRDSNLELYRIIVMLLIVAHHYVVNSGVMDRMYEESLRANSVFLFLFGAWGKTGINCFIMITGYFMCKSHATLEKYLKLITEVLFYNIALSVLFIVTGYGTMGDMLDAIFFARTIDSGNFTACFLAFYPLMPFLNILLKNINKKQHQYLIALLAILYVFYGTMPGFHVVMNYVSWFSFLYFVAAYIRFYPIKRRNWGMWTLLFVAVGVASVVACLFLGEKLGKHIAYAFVSDSNTFLAFAIAVCSFMFFKDLHIKRSKIINAIGGSTFGVLCIHANSNRMRSWLWGTTFNVKGCYDFTTKKLIAYSFGTILIVFLGCTALELLRKRYIEKAVMSAITNCVAFEKLKRNFEIEESIR